MLKASLFPNTTSRDYGSRISQFETPGLTPIPSNTSTMPHTPPESQHNPKVFHRAQQIAARLYYQPSPETPHTAEIRTSLQYLRGLGRQSENSATTPGVSDTAVRRGGLGGNRGKESDPSMISNSSLPRKPRALFLSSENNNINDNVEPEGIDRDGEDEDKSHVEKEFAINENEYKDGGVQEILELLCVLGSGYRRLCQVRRLSYMLGLLVRCCAFFWCLVVLTSFRFHAFRT